MLVQPGQLVVEVRSAAAHVRRRGLGEHDRPPGVQQGLAGLAVHDLGDLADRLTRELVGRLVAVVQLEVVDAPGRVLIRVLLEVAVAAGRALTRLVAGVLVDAELQALAVDVVTEPLHAVRETGRVDLQVAVGVTVVLHPAVVDVDVVVTELVQAEVHDRVGRLGEQRLVHLAVAAEAGPGVEAHRRGQRQAVVGRRGVDRGAHWCCGLGRRGADGGAEANERSGREGGSGERGKHSSIALGAIACHDNFLDRGDLRDGSAVGACAQERAVDRPRSSG